MSKIAPEPPDAQTGFPIHISQDEAESENLRILSNLNREQPRSKFWFIAEEEELPLFFFRKVFTELRKQHSALTEELDNDDSIPIEMFQRAMERLFYVLEDDDGFDAHAVDKNRNGYVGWGEFVYVYKNFKKRIVIKLCLAERIFLTFDSPESSHLAQILSLFVLLTIILSSASFILSTTPEYQDPPRGPLGFEEKPTPKPAFDIIENVCLVIFVIEYVLRLSTCWAVRNEVLDKQRLLELAVGGEPIQLNYPVGRLKDFLTAPSNLVDLVAIVPGILGWISMLVDPDGSAMEGGAFVVLRLIRLTRIVRAFKNPKLVEPVIVIARTLSNSTKALYVLGFTLLLFILIFGSLMYVCEKGTWEPSTRRYLRTVGQEWNATIGVFEDVTDESPFLSIPHAFWWAVVTAMTVGYGDMYPRTTLGYMVATATMVFSLVILALPVGVIGGNFTKAWKLYERERLEQKAEREKDNKFIIAATCEMSTLMLVEVWNERCSLDRGGNMMGNLREIRSRTDQAEFMGQVNLQLELRQDTPCVYHSHTLTLRNTGNPDTPKQDITGTITVQYEWTPTAFKVEETQAMDDGIDLITLGDDTVNEHPVLRGRLKVTIVGADNLINLSYHRSKQKASNPYCMVFLYPNSQVKGTAICPSAWRSPTQPNTLHPRWNAAHSWNYCWLPPNAVQGLPVETEATQDFDKTQDFDQTSSRGSNPGRDDDILRALRSFNREILHLRNEVSEVNSRIFPTSTVPM
jgi:hypothetical protein